MKTISKPAQNLPQSEFAARTRRINAILKRLKLDALFIITDVNRYYFTGLLTSNGLILAEQGEEPLFFTDFRYLTVAKKQVQSMPSNLLWHPSDETKVVGGFGGTWKRVGFEGSITAARFNKFREALPDVEWVDVQSEITTLRSVKSKAECNAVRRACAANDLMLQNVLSRVEPGMSEWAVSSMIRQEADLLGQGESFESIVCVGKNGAECHHHPDVTVFRNNKPLLIDLGVKLDHYCSDMTRTTFFGKPTELYKKIYSIVLGANQKAISKIKPGITCGSVDKVARDYIDKAGYGKYFGHSLGHGIGLDIHESPNFSTGNETLLKPGMILSVEPGIYLPGRLGVRIEDVILVTRDGCEVLTGADRSGVRAV